MFLCIYNHLTRDTTKITNWSLCKSSCCFAKYRLQMYMINITGTTVNLCKKRNILISLWIKKDKRQLLLKCCHINFIITLWQNIATYYFATTGSSLIQSQSFSMASQEILFNYIINHDFYLCYEDGHSNYCVKSYNIYSFTLNPV